MGGARGFGHVGVFRALDDLGIAVDRVAGSSMGALAGAVWAAGQLGAFEDWARGLTRTNFMRYVDLRLSGGGIVAGNEIPRLLDMFGLPERIEELERPFGAVATDLRTGRVVWFASGPLRPAVRASVSIPGVLAPVHHGGQWLVDGALSDPVPVAGCRMLGDGPVLAVDPNGFGPAGFWTPPEPAAARGRAWLGPLRAGGQAAGLGAWLGAPDAALPSGPSAPHYMDVVWASVDIVAASVMRMRLAAAPPELMLELPLRDLGILEFDRAAEAIDAGHRAVMARAGEIRALAGM
nr:patatin-like phospholipase family protein [Mangrovicoccus sp. HB161399]